MTATPATLATAMRAAQDAVDTAQWQAAADHLAHAAILAGALAADAQPADPVPASLPHRGPRVRLPRRRMRSRLLRTCGLWRPSRTGPPTSTGSAWTNPSCSPSPQPCNSPAWTGSAGPPCASGCSSRPSTPEISSPACGTGNPPVRACLPGGGRRRPARRATSAAPGRAPRRPARRGPGRPRGSQSALTE